MLLKKLSKAAKKKG